MTQSDHHQLASTAAWLLLPQSIQRAQLWQQLDAAQTALNNADCTQATSAALIAITAAESLRAADSQRNAAFLIRTLRIALICADRNGDRITAFAWARMIVHLGGSQVDAALLALYPVADTTTTTPLLIPISVVGVAGEVSIAIDAATPKSLSSSLVIDPGLHLVTIVNQQRAASQLMNISDQTPINIVMPTVPSGSNQNTIELAAQPRQILDRWRGLIDSHASDTFPTVEEQQMLITTLFRFTKANRMIVFAGERSPSSSMWIRNDKGDAVLRQPWQQRSPTQWATDLQQPTSIELAKVVTKDRRAPDKDVALLLETEPRPRTARAGVRSEAKTEWWVYASIASAVVLGGAALYAHDSRQDQQRITVRWQP